jgi:2',3'-cyclic-nucleotide 2'-phosphodiesterase
VTEEIKILAVGDIIGKPGREAVAKFLPEIKSRENIDLCIANGENSAGGNGITPPVAEGLFSAGIDVITTGNHVWDKKEVKEIIGRRRNLIRPYNYPPGAPGPGYEIFELKGGLKAGVLNLAGRVFMNSLDCPFRKGEEAVRKIKETTPVIIVDIHAEATAEKSAMGWHMDGLVSAVFGTHTHVQTADERILPGGTAYITDIGMTGSMDSIIGVDRRQVIQRFLTQMPVRFQPESGNVHICGVVIGINAATGRALSIKRLDEPVPAPQ